MSSINISELKKISIEDKKILKNFLEPCNNILCDYNFTNLYSWSEIFDTKWMIAENTLIIYNSYEDWILMPCGNILCGKNEQNNSQKFCLTTKKILDISDSFIKKNKSGNFALIEKEFIDKFKTELEKHFEIQPDENNADYIYSSVKLVELKGKKLHKKKNLVSQFVKKNPNYSVSDITGSDTKECFDLAKKWCQSRDCEKTGFSHEKSAMLKVFENFTELEAGGIKIKLNDSITAFSIFSKQNSETYTIHYEKFDPEIKGSGQIINWETAKYLSEKCKFINREQDMGIEGLRQAKKSYDPDLILLTYKLIRKQ